MLGNGPCAGFRDPMFNCRACLLVRRTFDEFFDVDPIVPDVECVHERVVGHALAVLTHGAAGGPRRISLRQPQVTPGHHHARGQPLEIPLPRRRERFVENR